MRAICCQGLLGTRASAACVPAGCPSLVWLLCLPPAGSKRGVTGRRPWQDPCTGPEGQGLGCWVLQAGCDIERCSCHQVCQSQDVAFVCERRWATTQMGSYLKHQTILMHTGHEPKDA